MGMTDEALGRLAGMWLNYRFNRNQANDIGKAMGVRDGYNWDAENAAQKAANQVVNGNLWQQPNIGTTATDASNLVSQNLSQNIRPTNVGMQSPQPEKSLFQPGSFWATQQAQQQLPMQAPQQSLVGQQPLQPNTNLWNFRQQPNSTNVVQGFGQFNTLNPSETPLNASVNGEGIEKASNNLKFNVVSPTVGTMADKQMHQKLEEVNSFGVPDQNAIIKNYRYQRGKDIVALVKAGMSPKDAFEFANNRMQENVEGTYKKYANDFTDNVLEPMRQDIVNNLMYTTDENGNTVVDTYNSSKVKGMYGAVTRYNALASKVGAPQIDMNNLASAAAINRPNIKYQTMPNGAVVRIDGDTGQLVDTGKNYSKVSYLNTNNGTILSHDDAGRVSTVGNYGQVGMRQLEDGTTFLVGQDGRTQLVGKFAKPVATGGAGGTSGLQAQQLRTLAGLHQSWIKQHPDEDESASPYYSDLQTALNGDTNTQQSSDDHANLTGQDKAVADLIDQKRQSGESPEQIKAELEETFGKGNYYVDWVW